MNDKEKIAYSKFMSLILRHKPEKIGITLDKNGWANINELILGMNRSGYRNTTLEELKEIAETNDKRRFKFNENFTKIRANQGHSVTVDVDMVEAMPPDRLFHGTATRFIQSIKNEGLVSKSRLHVHLSDNVETAAKVGGRHGVPFVLTIDSRKMYEDGFKFYLSDNNVWLTASVPAVYINEI